MTRMRVNFPRVCSATLVSASDDQNAKVASQIGENRTPQRAVCNTQKPGGRRYQLTEEERNTSRPGSSA